MCQIYNNLSEYIVPQHKAITNNILTMKLENIEFLCLQTEEKIQFYFITVYKNINISIKNGICFKIDQVGHKYGYIQHKIDKKPSITTPTRFIS